MKESANRRGSTWAKKDRRKATTLKVAAHLLAVLPKRQPQKVKTKLEPLKSIRGSSSLRLEDPPR